MTIHEELELIGESLEEKGLGQNQMALLEEKIRLLERLIGDPKEYKEYDNLPVPERYEKLKEVAKKVKDGTHREEVLIIDSWKKPIERKIEETQAELVLGGPVNLQKKVDSKKREFYADIIGSDAANEIRIRAKSKADELEQLGKAAKEVNPKDASIIESWDLTEEQRDYIDIHNILDDFFYKGSEQNSGENIELNIVRLKEIKKKYQNVTGKVEESEISKKIRELLNSSKVTLLIDAYNKRLGIVEKEEGLGELTSSDSAIETGMEEKE